MNRIKKFEDIESWKSARKLTSEIYQATLANDFARDFGLKDQIRKASVSILSNIAEGYERGNDKNSPTSWPLQKARPARYAPNYM